jgi:ketosteroid isomerase-like protein
MATSDDSALAARLDRIESGQEIAPLPSRYAMALDARDLDALVALFIEDVEAGAQGRGRQALKAWFDGVLRRFYRSIHLICGHRFDLLSRRTRGW